MDESCDEEGSESENNNGVEDDQKMGEEEGSVSGNDTNEEGSCDNSSGEDGSGEDGSGTEEDSEAQSDAGNEEAENQEIVREQSVANIVEDGSRSSATVKLQMKHQASVNHLEDMTAPGLLNCISSSLKTYLRKKQLSSRRLQISATSLLDNGDVEVTVQAKTREALQMFIDLGGWSQYFELTLIGPQVPTYEVKMFHVKSEGLNFRNRKEKSVIIRRLVAENCALGHGDGVKIIIRDIRWCYDLSPCIKGSLIVEFLDPEQATQALMRGLVWQKWRHGCARADDNHVLRCTRCQGYGHLYEKCSAPYRCGKCAGQHSTGTCKSDIVKCASCGGNHLAGSTRCSAKLKARRSLGFTNENTFKATKPAVDAQGTPSSGVRHSVSAARTQTEASMPSPVSLDVDSAEDEIKSGSDHSVSESDPTPDTHPDTATLRQELEDLKKRVKDLDTALQTTVLAGTKRRAGETFVGGAEAESSNMAAKRIKK